jgi:hypothetical protein
MDENFVRQIGPPPGFANHAQHAEAFNAPPLQCGDAECPQRAVHHSNVGHGAPQPDRTVKRNLCFAIAIPHLA